MSYIDRVPAIAQHDVDVLLKKDKEYGGSWKLRGGTGAFMMLARKWDRIDNLVKRPAYMLPDAEGNTRAAERWDIFQHALLDNREEGLLDDIGDLRRYLLLVEAEIRNLMEDRRGED